MKAFSRSSGGSILAIIAAISLVGCGSGAAAPSAASKPAQASASAAAPASASAAASASASGTAYELGAVVSQTGSISQLGIGEGNSVKMLVDQTNQKGGIDGHQIHLTLLDDASTPDQAVKAARQLQQQKVAAILGPTIAAACNAVAALAETSGPVNYCFSPGITPKDNSYIWSSSVSTRLLAQRMMVHWKSQNITRIGLISTTDASGQDGAKSVRAAVQDTGGTIVADVSYAPDAVDATPQLEQIRTSNPQAIVVWSSGTPAGVAFKGISQLGIDVPMATTNANLAYAFVKRIADYTPKTFLIPAPQDFWWDQI